MSLSNRLVHIPLLRIIDVCQRNSLGSSFIILVSRKRRIIEVHHSFDMKSVDLVDNLITTVNVFIVIN